MPKTVEQLTEQGQWLGAGQLMLVVDRHRQEAMEAIGDLEWFFCDGDQEDDGQADADVYAGAWAVQLALMLMLLFGYVPPMRGALILSLTAPDDSSGQCVQPGCQFPHTCRGNVVCKHAPSGSYQLLAMHHKCGNHWKKAITAFLPADFTELLDWHLDRGRPILTKSSEHTVPWLFVNKHGLQMQGPEFTKLFQEVLAPEGVKFGPHRARHIFATSSASGQLGAQQSKGGAALLMGHAERMWDSTYDVEFKNRESLAVINDLGKWRESVLAAALLEQQQQDDEEEVQCSWEEEEEEQHGAEYGSSGSSAREDDDDGQQTTPQGQHVYFDDDGQPTAVAPSPAKRHKTIAC